MKCCRLREKTRPRDSDWSNNMYDVIWIRVRGMNCRYCNVSRCLLYVASWPTNQTTKRIFSENKHFPTPAMLYGVCHQLTNPLHHQDFTNQLNHQDIHLRNIPPHQFCRISHLTKNHQDWPSNKSPEKFPTSALFMSPADQPTEPPIEFSQKTYFPTPALSFVAS